MFISILALVSIAANFFLCTKIIHYYKEINLLRLDPLETSFKRKFKKSGALNKKDPLILMFGDSRIANWRPQLDLPGCTLINRGVRGQTTQQLLLRLEKDVLSYSPDIVVFQAGVNDLKNIGLFQDRKEDIISKCKENISIMNDMMDRRQIETVVLTIFPTGKPGILRRWFWPAETNAAITEVNDSLKETGKRKVHIIDADEILGDGQYIRPEYKRDMLHLNKKGYMKLNEFLKPYLEDLLSRRTDAAAR